MLIAGDRSAGESLPQPLALVFRDHRFQLRRENDRERLGVAPLVDGVYAEEETGSKRTEAPYAFFRDRLGVPYEKMLLAEDAPRNLAAAEALGVSGVGVYDESMKEYTEMIRAGAAVYLPDFSDLSALEELLR